MKFGILPECSDIICLPCLKQYRLNNSISICPVCSVHSYYIIPSHGYPKNEERKKQITEAFKLKMANIPCKYFDNGHGECKYGEVCYFLHQINESPLNP